MYSHLPLPPPPPYYHNAPHYPVKHRKRSGGGSGCCRCIYCCCCFLFLLVLLTIAVTFAMYQVYNPKLPVYDVSDLKVTTLDMKLDDSSVTTAIELTVRAENPNKRIGFVYGDDNSIDVAFKDVVICSGKVPGFHQGTENTTVIKVDLKGNATFDEGMRKAYGDGRARRRIPLLVTIRVPVNLVVGEVVLREIKAFVNCNVVLDDLAPDGDAKILSKETSVRFEL